MASGSVDQKNTYVFEAIPRAVAEGVASEMCYWSTANGDDTMVTLWNPADEPQDFAFTLFYTGGHYVYPIQLGPRETRSLNVSEILHTSIPDAGGNVIPAGILQGSAEIAGLLGENQQILISVDAAVYNVRKAICGTVCWQCGGVASSAIALSPFAVDVAGTTGETFYETGTSGNQYSVSANWSSSAATIATVNNSGVVTGVNPGSLSISASDLNSETVSEWFCTEGFNPCPTFVPSASAPGNTRPKISGPNTVWFFGNLTVSGYATSIQLTASGGSSSTSWNITAGANNITVSTFTGASITVQSSGTAFSSSVGDTKLTAKVNGQTSAPFAITTRTPNILIAGAITTNCDSTYGYLTTLNYDIEDQLNASLPNTVPVNENWTTGVINDFSGTNWRRGDPNGVNQPYSSLADLIGGEDFRLPPNPVPTCDGNNTAVVHWGQEWRVGSLASGFGRRVQTDTLQKFKGHALHTVITSPAP